MLGQLLSPGLLPLVLLAAISLIVAGTLLYYLSSMWIQDRAMARALTRASVAVECAATTRRYTRATWRHQPMRVVGTTEARSLES